MIGFARVAKMWREVKWELIEKAVGFPSWDAVLELFIKTPVIGLAFVTRPRSAVEQPLLAIYWHVI